MPDLQAPVYVNWGRLVVDCPAPGCGDAREVEPGQTTATCCAGGPCPGHTFALVWPDNMPAILAALVERVSGKRRNWMPHGHPLARLGFPCGETPDELRAETAAGEAADADLVTSKRHELITELRSLGSDDEIIDEIRGAL